MNLFLFGELTVTPEQIAQVVREQLATGYTMADRLRSAVMYLPVTVTVQEFITAAALAGVKEGTARNRFHEVRRWQKELGEI